ncbi:MAG: hypothetical protein QF368_18985 [SAR202 cluster bacterium]|nr:hypothetical protein [SAR202 cluster bacterium]
MSPRNPGPWLEIRPFLNLLDKVLAEDLQSLRAETDETVRGWQDELTTYWSNFRDKWAPNLGTDLQQEIRSRASLARLLLETRLNLSNSQESAFSAHERSLLRDFERYKILDVMSEGDIVQGINDQRQGLFEIAVDFYNKGYDRFDAMLNDSRSIRGDLVHAFTKRYGERYEKIRTSMARVDLGQLTRIQSLTPERIEGLSKLSIEALIAISGPLQSRILADLAQVRQLQGSSPEQIMAIGALNNPAFASAYGDIMVSMARTGDLDMYERLISEIKESSGRERDDYQRNLNIVVEMFHKAVESLSETAVAFSGQSSQRPHTQS